MILNRRNQLLSGLLIIQLALAVFLLWPRGSTADSNGGPMFPDLTTNQVTGLTIRDGQDRQVHFVKENGQWVLADSDGFPAKADAINDLLDQIMDLSTGRLVTRTKASHRQLKVATDDFERRIDLETADGKTVTLFVGSTVSARAAHVRAGDRDEVFLAQGITPWKINAGVAGWIDAVYLSVNQDKVQSITLENANGTFKFRKDADGNWGMQGLAEGEEFNPNNLTSLLTRLGSLNMTRPLGKTEKPEYGLAAPQAVLSIVAEDDAGAAKTITLTVGAALDDGNGHAVKSSESPYYAEMSTYSVEDFINRTRTDFLAQPTPEPDATATPAP